MRELTELSVPCDSNMRKGTNWLRKTAGLVLLAICCCGFGLIAASTTVFSFLGWSPTTTRTSAIGKSYYVTKEFPPNISGDKRTLVFDFRLVNETGTHQHSLRAVSTSCACSRVVIDREELEPGKETRVWIESDIGNRVGSQRIACRVESEEGVAWVCEATTNIYPRARFVPDCLSLGSLIPGKETSCTAQLELRAKQGEKPPKLVKVVAQNDAKNVTIKTSKEKQDEDQWSIADLEKLEIRINPGFIDGETFLTAVYDYDGGLHEAQLPVSWRIKKFYTIDPQRVFFGRVKEKDGSVTRSATIRPSKRGPFTIQTVKSSSKAVACTYRREEDGKYTLTLTLQPECFTGFLHGNVAVETNHANQPVILLPFAAYKESAILRARVSAE